MKKRENPIENEGLCGYLSPDGDYIPCEPWTHIDTAVKIVKSIDVNKEFDKSFKYETYLLEELGYIQFTSRACIFKIRNYAKVRRHLTDNQRKFLEENIIHSQNSEQRKSIEFILQLNEKIKEGSILLEYENRFLG